jgi:hypothetical protein
MDDLKEDLLIENIDANPQLADIVYRIKTIIRLIFDTSTGYKLYFLEDFNLMKTAVATSAKLPIPTLASKKLNSIEVEKVVIDIKCPKCRKNHSIVGYFDVSSEQVKQLKLPINNNIQNNDILVCDNCDCNHTMDLKPIKNQIEAQSKRKVTFK